MALNDNRDRLAAAHHNDGREPASRITIRRRRHRPISPAVVPTLSPREQASAYTLGIRNSQVSLSVMGGAASLSSPSTERGSEWAGSTRAEPQARLSRPLLLSKRDRRRIGGAGHPSGHPAIGRPVVSPNIIPFHREV